MYLLSHIFYWRQRTTSNQKEVGSVQPDSKKPPQNVPNIYVLNKEGYEQEIEWAIAKMLEIYEVDSFGEIKGGHKN